MISQVISVHMKHKHSHLITNYSKIKSFAVFFLSIVLLFKDLMNLNV